MPVKSGPMSLMFVMAILVPAFNSGRKKNPPMQKTRKVAIVSIRMYFSRILKTDLLDELLMNEVAGYEFDEEGDRNGTAAGSIVLRPVCLLDPIS